ncbi:hypothetical protein BH11MYX1_BH11MYX1_12310 [soil metagenome]
MAVIYFAEQDPAKAVTAAFKQPTATTSLGWDSMRKAIVYHPYIVRVTSRTGDIVTFRFVQATQGAKTGTDVGGDHTVDLTNLRFVFPDNPSTLPAATELAAGNAYAFLFFTEAFIASSPTVTTDAAGSGGGTGKHPLGSEYY